MGLKKAGRSCGGPVDGGACLGAVVVALVFLFGPAAWADCGPTAGNIAPLESRPLTVRFFGVSTLMFDDGESRVLVDGFFSRPKLLAKTFPWVARLYSDEALVEQHVAPGPPLGAVLVAHGHHDHALDIGAVARSAPDARIVGAPAVTQLARARGAAEAQLCTVSAPETDWMRHGAFRIKAVKVRHGDTFFPIAWMLDHPASEAPPVGARFWSYDDNENLSFLIEHGTVRILVHPSAGLAPAELVQWDAQVVFLGVGRLGRQSRAEAEKYLDSVLGSKPAAADAPLRVVVPIHWDRFDTPLGDPLVDTPLLDDVPKGFEHLCRHLRGSAVAVRRMQAMAVLKIDPSGRAETVAGVVEDGCAKRD